MTVETAKHLRIVRADLDDDYVEKRKKAVAAIAKSFRKRATTLEGLRLADTIVRTFRSQDFHVPDGMRSEVAPLIVAESSSFVADDGPLEISVCAVLAALTVLETAKGAVFNTSHFARALILGLDAVPPRAESRLETLRAEVLQIAGAAVDRSAAAARERSGVADPPAPIQGEVPEAYTKRLVEALAQTTSALARNATLDREELEVLWWVVNGRSEVLDTTFGSGESRAVAIATGVELASLLTAGPVEDAHRQLVTRHLSDATDSLPLSEFSSLVSTDATRIAEWVKRPMLTDLAALFPLLATISAAAQGQTAPIEAGGERPLCHWARRALDETWLARAALAAG